MLLRHGVVSDSDVSLAYLALLYPLVSGDLFTSPPRCLRKIHVTEAHVNPDVVIVRTFMLMLYKSSKNEYEDVVQE